MHPSTDFARRVVLGLRTTTIPWTKPTALLSESRLQSRGLRYGQSGHSTNDRFGSAARRIPRARTSPDAGALAGVSAHPAVISAELLHRALTEPGGTAIQRPLIQAEVARELGRMVLALTRDTPGGRSPASPAPRDRYAIATALDRLKADFHINRLEAHEGYLAGVWTPKVVVSSQRLGTITLPGAMPLAQTVDVSGAKLAAISEQEPLAAGATSIKMVVPAVDPATMQLSVITGRARLAEELELSPGAAPHHHIEYVGGITWDEP